MRVWLGYGGGPRPRRSPMNRPSRVSLPTWSVSIWPNGSMEPWLRHILGRSSLNNLPGRLRHQGTGTGPRTCTEGEDSPKKEGAEEKGRSFSIDRTQPERSSGFVPVCPDAAWTDPESLAPRVRLGMKKTARGRWKPGKGSSSMFSLPMERSLWPVC